jgi:hypothetical protein
MKTRRRVRSLPPLPPPGLDRDAPVYVGARPAMSGMFRVPRERTDKEKRAV